MGRISGYGWSLGYFGGLLTLGLCLGWITWAQSHGQEASDYVPATLWITAGIFALAALPTFATLAVNGGLFVLVTLLLPRGIAGLWRRKGTES